MSTALLAVESLTKTFRGEKRWPFGRAKAIQAVLNVNLRLDEGETLGIVGESGSGKTTLARLLLRLEAPTSGKIYFRGRVIEKLSSNELREFRQTVQAVFQDPYTSLSPRMRIGEIIAEPLVAAGQHARADIKQLVAGALERVGLVPSTVDLYPHELSGGQRQRIAIARALACGPKVVVLDEPVSSLDVSTRVQVLNLLRDLQAQFGLAYLFISHDLSSVRYLCRRIAVMYLGSVIEEGPATAVLSRPLHPYTRLLRAAALPRWKGKKNALDGALQASDAGEILQVQTGCPYHPRCPYSSAICLAQEPVLHEHERARFVACHHAQELQETTQHELSVL